MKSNVKIRGFALLEIIITIAVISIFIAYFGVYSNFYNNNIRETKHRSKVTEVAREVIEKSSSNGQLVDLEQINNRHNIQVNVDKLEEKNRYIKYELTLKDDEGKEYQYVFSIDKRKRAKNKSV